MLHIGSLYSGIGAFEEALKREGLEYVLEFFSEIDKYAIETYCTIHEEREEKNIGDINQVTEEDIAKVGDIDILTYGFPCQSFSMAGMRKGFADERTGNLFFESMRVVRQKKPRILIAENVTGLVNHDNGQTLGVVLSTLEELGYINTYKVLNARDYGVAQARERIFIISIREDIYKGFEFEEKQNLQTTVSDILEEGVTRYCKEDLRPYLLQKETHKTYKSNKGLCKIFDGVAQGYMPTNRAGNRIYSTKGVCPTLTTKKGDCVFLEAGGELTNLERWRLQGFLDTDYNKVKDKVPPGAILRQTGNSICVPVVQSIYRQLHRFGYL